MHPLTNKVQGCHTGAPKGTKTKTLLQTSFTKQGSVMPCMSPQGIKTKELLQALLNNLI